MLDRLRRQVDEFFARAQAAQPGAFACRAGCRRCCHSDLVLFGIEGDRIVAALRRLSAAQRKAVAKRAEEGQHCALLSPRSGHCVVYDERPLICRAFGVAVRFEGVVTWCPLNFTEVAPRRELVLALDAVNHELRALERKASADGKTERHVRISDLAGRAVR